MEVSMRMHQKHIGGRELSGGRHGQVRAVTSLMHPQHGLRKRTGIVCP